MNKAVVLLSGGLDSATCLADAISEKVEPIALSFDYGQKNKVELEHAKAIAEYYGVEHKIFKIDLSQIGGSALTDNNIDVPNKDPGSEIPVTWVPQRNSIFLSIAFAYAEVIGANFVTIGVNNIDYSGYPDCRPEFIKMAEIALNFGSKRSVEENDPIILVTPLIGMSKAEIVKIAEKLEAPIHLTRSCYNTEEESCGTCEACKIRLKAFKEAGIEDPIKYKKQ